MIDPTGIRRKAENLYGAFLCAWLAGEDFFPRTLPCNKKLDVNLAAAIASVQELRAGSKECRGFGYVIAWEEKNSRTHGKNLFPRQITFETPRDFLKLIERERDFTRFAGAVNRVRAQFPELQTWIRSHRKLLVEVADEIEGLLEVANYFVAHPRPNLFARELPLAVDTKFIERHRHVLRDWLDLVLPPQVISAEEEHFERRYGLRYAEPLILVRFLDDAVRQATGVPWESLAVPLPSLASALMRPERVFIVENKVNLLTLPPLPGAIALGGLGSGVNDLRYLPWLRESDVWYWGDIDVEGFAILSRLRVVLPHVRSLLMNSDTFQNWREQLLTKGSGQRFPPPANLTSSEEEAFRLCAAENGRIEQERIPQTAVVDALKSRLGE